ncbi:hypothetical protein BD770DRAFT_218280 [Pilaira anomala]|nr:hypothetical protein BD770DRAFT_218280 [Pilaira anomala]
MQKFPNLQSFGILSGFDENDGTIITANCPSNAIIEFLRYVNTIPDYDIEISIATQDLAVIWIEFINMDDIRRDVTIELIDDDQRCDTADDTLSILQFWLYDEMVELPYIDFFSDAGSMIRSLKLRDVADIRSMADADSVFFTELIGIDWVFGMLQLCPSLKKLTVAVSAYGIQSSNLVFRHKGLKKLKVFNIRDTPNSIHFLKYMSLHAPNIRKLSLFYSDRMFYRTETVFMPNTWLYLLISTNYPPSAENSNFKAFIRLDTDKGASFYEGNKAVCSKFSSHRFDWIF